jgi:hypothetical protein
MSEQKTYTVPRDGKPDLRFEGEELASASTKTIDGPGQNRFYRFTLFKTSKGKYVCHTEYVTYWQNEDGTSEAMICDTVQDVIECFGFSDSAKEMYAEAGFDVADYTEHVG